jgi:putative flippase GtrA
MSGQIKRYLLAGGFTVGLYVGGGWLGTQVFTLPVRPTNALLYITTTGLSFLLNYKWVFTSKANAGGALMSFIALQIFGILFNIIWVETGLRFTYLYPWIIAASFFAVWPVLSFTIQKHLIFNR